MPVRPVHRRACYPPDAMNGAHAMIRTATNAGVEVCFANPGTSEIHLVAALDEVPGVRSVLAQFEGVATGAADGYGRMAGKPALTLVHLGPGFANGIANLHNARRGRTPVVNVIGHHPTWHRNYDPPLNTQVESLAAGVSDWQRTVASADHISRDMAAAISASMHHPGQVATLIVPTDCQWSEAYGPIVEPTPPPGARVGQDAVERAREAVVRGKRTMVLLGSSGHTASAQREAARVQLTTGCRIAAETFSGRMERGPHLPLLPRVPYFPEQAVEFFADVDTVVLAGALDPVAFFGYEGGVSRLIPESTRVLVLSHPTEDSSHALAELAAAVDAAGEPPAREVERPPAPAGPIDARVAAQAVAATLPENAIVMDEGITVGAAFYPATMKGPSHTYLQENGGAIGLGLPAALGAAIACPDRKVLNLEGDGSGLYTIQALWSQVREGVDVVNLVFANDAYRILQVELQRAGVEEFGPQSLNLTELGGPRVEWLDLARGFGMPAVQVRTGEELTEALARGFAEPGPCLIEALVADGFS